MLSISATTPAAAARTTSAAAASCRPRANTSATVRAPRHCSSRPAARTRSRCLSIGSGGTYLLAGRRLAGQWQSREPGNLRRQRHAGIAQRQRHLGSLQRHLAGPGSPLGEHGRQLALDRARGIRPVDGLRPLQQLGFDPHPRHHAHGAGRAGLWRFGLDQRSGQLPRNDYGRSPAVPSTSAEG